MDVRPVRIAPQLPREWSDATRTELAGVVPTGGSTRPVHLPGVIAHHPTLLAPYLVWAKAIALHGVLAPRDNALLALRTAVLARSAFEWGVHADSAPSRAGLRNDEIDAIGIGPSDESWSPRDRALLQAADDLHREHSVSDATWHALGQDHDDASRLEIVFVVGHYTMLSMVANSSGVSPETHWRDLPSAG